MKPSQYNPKAKEAYANSLIDIGVSMFKYLMLLITTVPILIIFKSAMGPKKFVPSFDLFDNISKGTTVAILMMMLITFLLAHYLRRVGLKYLHDIENK